ncbi:MAG TPA: metalloregulator ArsR/SmtB family transcription factor [Bryobacteraceae bacterium]|jgi:predicted ArsR family transcriptional regulator
MQDRKRRKAEGPTRRSVLDRLKQNGPQDANSLSKDLDVTPMAVRQHLYELEKEGLVAFSEEARPMGRPAKLWRVTPAADRFFPDRHGDLAVGLIGAVREAFGPCGLERLVSIRSERQLESYCARIPARASLPRCLEALAAIRTEEGYMAEVRRRPDGSFLFVENHCPICAAATACTGLCSAELDVFQRVLGAEVEIARAEHIISGARRCAYHVRLK